MPKRRLQRHPVTQPLDPSYKIIPLTKGKNALVDSSDHELLNAYNWYAALTSQGTFYAARRDGDRIVQMQNVILGTKADHRNWDTLDNRRQNLRPCSHAQNGYNIPKKKNNKSGYVGVYWHKAASKWCATIRGKRGHIYLGLFTDPKEAALAYDSECLRIRGEFAVLNFPDHWRIQPPSSNSR
jgi:hypothetical protein